MTTPEAIFFRLDKKKKKKGGEKTNTRPRWRLSAQYCILLSMASTLEDLAGLWESIERNPGLSEAERDALEAYTNRRERGIREREGSTTNA